MVFKIFSQIHDLFSVPQPPEPEDKISPELLRKVRAIQVKSNFLVNDLMAGEYVSAFKGRGMEFSEVREYFPGDDIRLIDWNVTARMGHPYIKEFKEERELTLMLIVDVSSSGEFGSAGKLKNEISAEIASILAYAAIKNNDKVGLIVFSDKIEHYIPPKKGRSHIWNIIRTILDFKPEGRGTDLRLPLEYLLNIQKRKAVAFVISDFQARNYENTIKLANQKHDITAITIMDPREREIPNIGLLRLEDAESGETILIDTRDQRLTRRFAELGVNNHLQKKKFLNSAGIDVIEVWTNESPIKPIVRYFKMREKKH